MARSVFTACAVSTQPDTSRSAVIFGSWAAARSKNLIMPWKDSVVTFVVVSALRNLTREAGSGGWGRNPDVRK